MTKTILRFNGYSTGSIYPWGRDQNFYWIEINEWTRWNYFRQWWFEWRWWHLNPCRTRLYKRISRWLSRHGAADVITLLTEEGPYRWRDRFVGWSMQQDLKSYELSCKCQQLTKWGPVEKTVWDRLQPTTRRIQTIMDRTERKRQTQRPNSATLLDRVLIQDIQPLKMLSSFVDPGVLYAVSQADRPRRRAELERFLERGIHDELRALGYRYPHEEEGEE